MNYRFYVPVVIAIAFLLAMPDNSSAQQIADASAKPFPFVSPIFGDNMVLQRDKTNTIWGWSDPGDKVTVDIADKTGSSVAGADHRWQVKILPPPAGGPYTVSIRGHQNLELHNVLVGDVWLCGGQSNMQVSLRSVRNAEDEIKSANH